MEKVGKAYGFFDCKASKEAIESELPVIRKMVKSPSNLELSLIEGVENLRGDTGLSSLAREAKEDGMKYALESTYPGADNKSAADELATILNQFYHSPLYSEEEQFRGHIVYRERGRYIFRE